MQEFSSELCVCVCVAVLEQQRDAPNPEMIHFHTERVNQCAQMSGWALNTNPSYRFIYFLATFVTLQFWAPKGPKVVYFR